MIAAPALADVKSALRVDDDASDAPLTRIIAAVTERANKQAPDAPETVGHQAIIQAVGYLYDAPPAGEAMASNAGWWMKSGAAALLKPWTERRAGAIG